MSPSTRIRAVLAYPAGVFRSASRPDLATSLRPSSPSTRISLRQEASRRQAYRRNEEHDDKCSANDIAPTNCINRRTENRCSEGGHGGDKELGRDDPRASDPRIAQLRGGSNSIKDSSSDPMSILPPFSLKPKLRTAVMTENDPRSIADPRDPKDVIVGASVIYLPLRNSSANSHHSANRSAIAGRTECRVVPSGGAPTILCQAQEPYPVREVVGRVHLHVPVDGGL